MRLWKYLPLTLGTFALIGTLAVSSMSCGDSKPAPTTDTGVKKDGLPGTDAPVDGPGNVDQTPVKQDKFVWPDIKGPGDTWPWPKDQYVGQPFGCQADTDCFGQKCCPTPWGVKLCAPTCDLK